MRSNIALRLAAMFCLCSFSMSAQASLIPTLDSIVADAINGGNVYSYDGILAPDQGLSTSAINPGNGLNYISKIVIFDFGGYIDNTVFSTNTLFDASVELVSPGLPIAMGFADNAALYNLVFTYNGPDQRMTGGPYAQLDLGTFGASSVLANTMMSSFSAAGVKNTGTPFAMGGEAGTAAFNQGSVLVPANAVPEPSTWALLLIGFGSIGVVMRRGSVRQGRKLQAI